MSSRPTIQEILSEVTDRLRPYDSADLLSGAGALQLLPENADRTLRLETLAHVASTLAERPGKPRISRKRLADVCNSGPLGQGYLAAQEDPFNNPFTEAMTFHGGSYVVFPGTVEEATYTSARLASAIFLRRAGPVAPEFARLAYEAFRGILAISDAVARRAGLPRGAEPVSASGQDVVIPSADRLNALKRTVTFTQDDLLALLDQNGLQPHALDPFITPLGTAGLDEIDIENGPLSARPLVTAGRDVIVGAPGLLLAALRHRIICLAKDYSILDELALRFTEAVWGAVIRSLRYLRHPPMGAALPQRSDLKCYHDGFFTLDADKILYVQLVTDDLADYGDQVFSAWDSKDLVQSLEERARLAERHVFSLPNPPNEVLNLFLADSPTRSFVLGLGPPEASLESPRLVMTAADLETIALLEGGNPLALWKYAKASDRVRRRTRVFSFSQLDEYHLFRSLAYSYYHSDDARPDVISIAPGEAGIARREAHRKRDWHGALSYRRGHYLEVTCLHDGPRVPLYISLSDIGRRVSLLVESLPFPVWIVGPDDEDSDAESSHSTYTELAETIGYWLWQFTPTLDSILRQVPNQDILIFWLCLENPREWSRVLPKPGSANRPKEETRMVTFEVDPKEASIRLELHSGLRELLSSADNRGERELMAAVLRSIRGFARKAGVNTASLLAEEEIADILDRYAPLGLKKKLLLLDASTNPELDPQGLPPFRKVQPADENELLDELGAYLGEQAGLNEGPIPDEKRIEVLGVGVEFLYRRLEAMVATLSPEGLLDWLIAGHEAITREVAYLKLTMPTRLACFGEQGEMVEQLQRELLDANRAALCCRFLIEYVATRPPSGIRPMSLTLYDRLMALASAIINWGTDSDLIYFEIAEIKLAMLGSGRLGIAADTYRDARQGFLRAHTAWEIQQAAEMFPRYWGRGTVQDSRPPDWVIRADGAFRAEFGYTLTEFVILLSEIMALAQERQGAVKTIVLSELVDILSRRLKRSPDFVSRALSSLSLSERADFLAPDEPFQRPDVYPWRFNRALSYLRRPLLMRVADEDIQMVWGNRHVRQAGLYLLELYASGRLKAQSHEMKRAITTARQKESDDFNSLVANLFRQCPGLKIRERVKKIGKQRLGGPGQGLGDIDVLAANPARRRLVLVECKDLAVARTPHELANELQTLFLGRKKKKAVVELHQNRAVWVEEHLADVLQFLCLPKEGRWEVAAIVVVDEEISSPYVYKAAMPVLSVRRLEQEFLPDWSGG